MVPGFLVADRRASPRQRAETTVALASPWDFDNGSGRRTKICGQPMTRTSCVAGVLWCQNYRMCHWSDSYGIFEDSTLWYACGLCSGW
jgi:hypothetical protein